MGGWCVKERGFIYHSLLSSYYVALAVGRNHRAYIPFSSSMFGVLIVNYGSTRAQMKVQSHTATAVRVSGSEMLVANT